MGSNGTKHHKGARALLLARPCIAAMYYGVDVRRNDAFETRDSPTFITDTARGPNDRASMCGSGSVRGCRASNGATGRP